ncbi:hypothetical protein GZH53_04070 [Flavihumibacter sp. R14]|nr:hypothetical protein [Flavihumibacter soli]
MELKKIFNGIVREFKVLTGDKPKNREYSNENSFPDEGSAKKAFEESKRKLFDVNGWSAMEGINSKFTLYSKEGKLANHGLKPGYFIRIELPGPPVENWVRITAVKNEPELAEFTVHPSEKPAEKSNPDAEVKHFFAKEASSTFRVTRTGSVLHAFEIGRNELINNQGEESGDRQLLNTLIAEGGWAGFQKIQWDKLTKYLVHSDDVETK